MTYFLFVFLLGAVTATLVQNKAVRDKLIAAAKEFVSDVKTEVNKPDATKPKE